MPELGLAEPECRVRHSLSETESFREPPRSVGGGSREEEHGCRSGCGSCRGRGKKRGSGRWLVWDIAREVGKAEASAEEAGNAENAFEVSKEGKVWGMKDL